MREGAAIPPPLSMLRYGKLQDPSIASGLQKLVASAGSNPYGEPLFRLVWGQKRLGWIGGKFENEGVAPYIAVQLVPRYFGQEAERWHLEIWQPPSYSPEQWDENFTAIVDGIKVEQLGPYPSRGDYESAYSMLPEVVNRPSTWQDILAAALRARELSHAMRREAIMNSIAKSDKDWNTDADAILGDNPRSWKRPNIAVPHNYRSDS